MPLETMAVASMRIEAALDKVCCILWLQFLTVVSSVAYWTSTRKLMTLHHRVEVLTASIQALKL